MKVLIIEDEEPAAKRLAKMLLEADPAIIISETLHSVKASIKYLQSATPDLIVMDIQLADGISFEIFKSVEVKTPVIFVTAFDEYAIQAFKFNSVDYLLKPVKREELRNAISKYKKLTGNHSYENLIESLPSSQAGNYQKRFVVHFGQQLKAIDVDEVAYFYTQDKIVFICCKDGKRYIIDFNLDQLDQSLDPGKFFRINRQYIVCINAIEKMTSYPKSRVKIDLNPVAPHETVTSTERSPNFKLWLAGRKK
jgi:DNA-binding LytR/AlgR family response regulator